MKQETKIKARYKNLVPITSDIDHPRNVDVVIVASNGRGKIETFKPNDSYMRELDKVLFTSGDDRVIIDGNYGSKMYRKTGDTTYLSKEGQPCRTLAYVVE